MSAVPGSVTVTFVADLSAAYAAYNAFLAYVAANPPTMNWQGGPGGGGGGGIVNNYHNVTNNYQTTRNIVVNRSGGGRGGGGGRGRGGGGGRRGGMGGFGRYLRGVFLFHEATRAIKDYADYSIKAGAADSDLARFKAESGLQRSLFSLPLVGPVLDVATLPYRAQTEQTVQQAEAQDRQTAAMERAMEFSLGLSRQFAADAAGPAGSDPYRQQEIENRKAAEDERIRKQIRADNEEIDKKVEAAKSKATADATDYERNRRIAIVATAGIAAADPAVMRSLVGAPPDTEGADQVADADAEKSRAAVRAREAEYRRQVEDHARHEREDLEYQSRRSLEESQQRTRIAEAQYNLQPDVARADQTYFSGINAVEAARHRGRIPEALEDAQATRYRLLAEQRELLNSGRAVSVEGDPFSNAVGGPILDDQGGEHVSEEAKRDDLAEAIQELQGNLLPKIDQLIAELQGL